MNMIYNSHHYCIVEFADFDERYPAGGYEIVDKNLRREIFLGGRDAEQFRADVQELIANEPSLDEVDDFLGRYVGLMTQPVVLH